MKRNEFKERFSAWLSGEDLLRGMENETPEEKDVSGEPVIFADRPVKRVQRAQLRSFSAFYTVSAVICCIALIGVLLYTVAALPRYGELSENAEKLEREYLENGMEETGAVNVVSAIILSYRAFDTLGESFVLFTALCCVTVLLRQDGKNSAPRAIYKDLSGDLILRRSVSFVAPMAILYGFYVMFNGHLSPGGGFSGGATAGAGLILLSAAFGFERIDRFFTERMFEAVSASALGFYVLSKTYTFFMEANALDPHVPKGVPGSIFSGGLILPLNLAVGLVVTMTIFGIYCLFKRGRIGGRAEAAPRKAKGGRKPC